MQLEQLGPYRISRQIGRGGMGTVYQGFDVETGQPAAIKVLNPRLAVEEGFRERFETEIETLKKLKHPNIVRLYGFGEQEGQLYYAMELVARRQPRRRVAGRPALLVARDDDARHQAGQSTQARSTTMA